MELILMFALRQVLVRRFVMLATELTYLAM
jgi:hypothetical protein